jgi:anti-sigma factor ChrR (cupin superfamily)
MFIQAMSTRVWQTSAFDGIEFCYLWQAPATPGLTLLKLQAGAKLPLHTHPGWEQLFILRGELNFCGCRLQAGDHVVTSAATAHQLQVLHDAEVLVFAELPGVSILD